MPDSFSPTMKNKTTAHYRHSLWMAYTNRIQSIKRSQEAVDYYLEQGFAPDHSVLMSWKASVEIDELVLKTLNNAVLTIVNAELITEQESKVTVEEAWSILRSSFKTLAD